MTSSPSREARALPICMTLLMGLSAEKGMAGVETTNAVREALDSTRVHVQDQGFKQDVGMSAMEAGAQTFGINKNNFSAPISDVPLDHPNAMAVTDPADDIHRRNRLEESGKGGIHTTGEGLAKDIAGMNKDVPPRPTNEHYRNRSFYHEGNLAVPQKQETGLYCLPAMSSMAMQTTHHPAKMKIL